MSKENDNYRLRYELAGADETITNLKQQLAEKDNLIEFGREEIRKRNKRIDEIVERDKKLFDEKNKEIEELKQNQTQLAIQELEKVKNFVDGRTYCADYINKRIQDLKGE